MNGIYPRGVLIFALVLLFTATSGCLQAGNATSGSSEDTSVHEALPIDFSSIPSIDYQHEAPEWLNASSPPPDGIADIDYSRIPLMDSEQAGIWDQEGWNTSSVARIALEDCRVRQLLEKGGRIEGLTIELPPCPRDALSCGGPALSVQYPPVTIRFIVDEKQEKVVQTITQVPDDAHIGHFPGGFQVTSQYGVLLLRLSCES